MKSMSTVNSDAAIIAIINPITKREVFDFITCSLNVLFDETDRLLAKRKLILSEEFVQISA